MASREPFSRHRDHGSTDRRGLGERLVGVYEFAAAEYGWQPQEIEEALSDEQLVALLDAATDRITKRHSDEFDGWVHATRAGTIFASNQRAFASWQRSRDRERGRAPGLTGKSLEAAVMTLARSNPEYVVVGR